LIDTAGIRETKDIIEKIGVQRSKQTIENAELVILVLDASETLSQEDENLLELTENKQRIIVGNKKDLGPKLKIENMVLLSALKKEGIKTLEKAIIEELNLADIGDDFNYLSNIRHINKLEETKDILTKSLEAIDFGYPIDVVEIDLKQAWQKLGEIIGDYHPEDLIDELFSKFCLGK